MTLPTVIPSCGLVINHPTASDPAVFPLAGVITPGDALLAAYRDTGPLNLTAGNIHALEPEAGGDAVMAALLALNGALLDLHRFRCDRDNLSIAALRNFIHVVLFEPG